MKPEEIKELDYVLLKDGRKGSIVIVFDPSIKPQGYILDTGDEDDEPIITIDEIGKVLIRVLKD